MKYTIIALTALLLLTGCATWKDQYGNPVSSSDNFDCEHKCGAWDMRQSAIAAGMCMRQCFASKGYRQQ